MDNLFGQRVKLHTDCFHDDTAWTERYIKRNTAPDRTVTLSDDDGKIAAALYLEPMELAVKDRRIPFKFINCLGTRPDLRYRGYATRLLRKTFEIFRDIPLFVLLPFNVEFYIKQGFVPLNLTERVPIIGNSELEFRNYTPDDYEFCKSAYETFANRFDAHAVREESFLKWKFIEENDDNAIKIILKDGTAVGYVCFSEEYRIGEYAMLPPYDSPEVPAFKDSERLLFGSGNPFMLARLANVKELLGKIPYSESFSGKLEFNLSDGILSENCGKYTILIEKGNLTSFSFNSQTENGIDTLTAEQLTSLAVGCFCSDDNTVAEKIKSAFDKRNTLLFDIF